MALQIESPTLNSPLPESGTPGSPSVGIITRAFASGLFSGYSPVASGTVGSAVGLAIYCIPGFELAYVILPICVLVYLAGVRSAGAMERVYGHDPSEVTIDEVLGMWVSLLFLPKNLPIILIAFFVFRILDIVKPYPARRFDKAPGGTGIMMDDVISGVYTNLIIQLAIIFRIL